MVFSDGIKRAINLVSAFWNKNVFAQNNFCMMTGVMGVTGVTWASKIEGGGGEEGGEAKGSKYFEKKCLVS